MPQIVSIVIRPDGIEQRPQDHFARIPVSKALLVVGHGIDGDTKGRLKDRELNVMLAETVARLEAEGFHTAPGELGEQLVIAGLHPDVVVSGVRLRLGSSAAIEIMCPRSPCSRFSHIQRKPIKDASGKLGFMARVVQGGEVAVGTEVIIGEGPPA